MATGRAIITTDAPGCRETVKENLNGFLVPPKNSVALAEAMMKFVEKPALMQTMGKASRQLAENKFEVNEVNQAMLKYLRLDESSEL
jgi:glycosyltransferase involved in cell wall biosynthesis